MFKTINSTLKYSKYDISKQQLLSVEGETTQNSEKKTGQRYLWLLGYSHLFGFIPQYSHLSRFKTHYSAYA